MPIQNRKSLKLSKEAGVSPVPLVKAGFGKVDITPRVGVELCGFGPYLNRHSTRVVEPLFARAMAVELGETRWVLVSCDLIGLNAVLTRRIRELVRNATNLRDDQIMVHATHTHSGPCTIPEFIGWGDPDDPYLEVLPRLVAQACLEAVRDLAPATFHQARVAAPDFSYNRELPDIGRTNELVLEGKWQTDQPGETDVTAQVFRIDRSGKCAGFLTYFACHLVVCCAENTEIHGDFAGVATNRIEQEFPGAVGLFLQGAQGDINSNYVHGPAAQSLVALEKLGARFAEVIRAGLRQAQPFEVTNLATAQSDEPYTMEPFNEKTLRAKLAEQETMLAHAGRLFEKREWGMAMVYAKAIRRMLADGTPRPTLTVQSFRLGPFTFTGMPLEIMHRIKRRFQAELGEQALLLSVTNGYLGYAPLREHYHQATLRYSVFTVPLMLGSLPFTANMEDETLAAALNVTRRMGVGHVRSER